MRCRACAGTVPMRNDLTIYDHVADRRWLDDIRWGHTFKPPFPAAGMIQPANRLRG